MGFLSRWISITAFDLAKNLAETVKSDYKKVLDHPSKRGNVWKKASERLGVKFSSHKDAFLYYACFHGGGSETREIFCKLTGAVEDELQHENDKVNLDRYCICGLLENSSDSCHASAPMRQCLTCSEWYHIICLDIAPKDIQDDWKCNACVGKDVTLYVPEVFRSSFEVRRSLRKEKHSQPFSVKNIQTESIDKAQNGDTGVVKRDADMDGNLFKNIIIKIKEWIPLQSKFADLAEFATSSSYWSKFVTESVKHRHIGKKSLKNIIRRVYRLQRYTRYSQLFTNMLKESKVSDEIVTRYAYLIEEVFKEGSHPKESKCTTMLNPDEDVNGNRLRKRPDIILLSKEPCTPEDTKNSSSSKFCFSPEPVAPNTCSEAINTETTEKVILEDECQIVTPKDEKDAICEILGIQRADLSYKPPSTFEIRLEYSQIPLFFDFERKRLLENIWADFINQALLKSQFTCSFNARTDPAYSSCGCRIYGNCRKNCGLKFNLKFSEFPKQGEDWIGQVSAHGSYSLIQDKQTGRNITKVQRNKLASLFKTGKKPYNVFVNGMHEIHPLQLLHQNIPLRSKDVLRKIKSETIKANRHHQNPEEEIKYLHESYRSSHNPTTPIPGYIQHCQTTSESLSIHIYDYNSLQLYWNLLKYKRVDLRLDATGTVCKNRGKPKIYLYLLLAVTIEGDSFPLGIMLTEIHHRHNITNFLGGIKYSLIKLHPEVTQMAFSRIAVCDFSYAMIHSLVEGLNKETILDYLERSWRVLNNEEVWNDNRSCIYICASHFIKAVQRNVSRKLLQRLNETAKRRKQILELAVYASVRLLECSSIEDFKMVAGNVCLVFGKERICEDELEEKKKWMKTKALPVTLNLDEEQTADDDLEDDIDKENLYQSIREQSKFYKLFVSIKDRVLASDLTEEKAIENPYFSPEVISTFQNDKVAMLPFWIAAIPNLVVDSDFDSVTNAAIESCFNTLIHYYLENVNLLYSDLIKELITYYGGRRLEMAAIYSKTYLAKVRQPTSVPKEEKDEKWQRGKKRKPKYLSSLSTKKLKLSGKLFCAEPVHETTSANPTPFDPVLFDRILKLPGAIPWAGYYLDGKIKRKLSNTCPFDSQLFIIYSLSKLSIACQKYLKQLDDNEALGMTFCFELLIDLIDGKDFDMAKSFWLRHCNFNNFPNIQRVLGLHKRSGVIDCWGSEEEMFLFHIRKAFKVKEVFNCENDNCMKKDAFPALDSYFPSVDGLSVIRSVKQLTSTRYYKECPSCNGAVFGKFDWFDGVPLPFFPLHGSPGGIGPNSKYIVNSTEDELKDFQKISFGGYNFDLYAYTVFSKIESHYFGIFNTFPKVSHDGHSSVICKQYVPPDEILGVSTVWYVREGLIGT